MKTLKELWEENDCKPFGARMNNGWFFYCVAIAHGRNEQAVGWNINGDAQIESSHDSVWEYCPDPTKPKLQMRVWKALASGKLILAKDVTFLKREDRDGDTVEDITADLAEALWPEIEKRLKEKG